MRPSSFTLRQIQYAVAVADASSFRRAAEHCHVSQPSLSAQIRELEEALGVRLFERDRRGVMITTAGSELIERMRRVLAEVDDVASAAGQFLDPLARTLHIGAIPTIGPYLLPAATRALRKEHPRLTLTWLEAKTDALVRRIRQGKLDGGFLALEAGVEDLDYETIEDDPFVLATPADHPLGRAPSPVPFRRLRGERILLLDEGHCFRDQVIEFCSRRGVEELSVRATSLPTLVQMVAAGMGITLLPHMAVRAEAPRSDLRTQPVTQPVPHRTVILAWRRQSATAEAMRKVARTVRGAVRTT
ncbi:MAG: LysR family transcriptional regulator [Acidobacteria bacterium]|nr:LysR family transcriptional regulator [Acidobacteriota bacterium]MYA47492.1 LysR family transcriptional regulator [Acidobacteriota bacterium]MYB31450.1 LysR family transcriptional regulator [Acidobacteriota bacterium]MYI40112.1 LysR family transcriptional regulator [Acidobacteriota bacterium]MYK79505.1 LysR family transcriptional regulator [Acidobacteriota bacterium]